MIILVILGDILMVLGILGLFSIVALSQAWAIVAFVVGLLLVVFSERGRFVR